MADDKKTEAILDKLSDPRQIEALNSLLDRITDLHESGVMDSFLQTIQAVTFMKDGLTDTMVNKNASVLADLVNIASEAASPEVMETVKELKEIHRTGKLKDLTQIADTMSFLLNSATDKMLERNAVAMSELMSMANEAADPVMIEAVRELKKLQSSGNLKLLGEASYMLAFMVNAMDDTMVQRMAGVMSSFVEEVAIPQMQDTLRAVTRSMSKTVKEFAQEKSKPSLGKVLSTMRDPEVQNGLIFMSTMAKNLQKCMMECYIGDKPK